jgi:hypothetical protein
MTTTNQQLAPIEFRPWESISPRWKRIENGTKEVLGRTFLGEAAWLPWMGA